MKKAFTLLCYLLMGMTALADDAPFSVVDGLYNATDKETMGLDYAPGAETFTVWAAKDDVRSGRKTVRYNYSFDGRKL